MGAWSTEFETGLVDDFAFTIRESIFAPDQQYNNGNTTLLQWRGTTDNPDLPETRIIYPLGKGWVSKDGGKTIVHESGKANKYFVASSLIAKLIERCVNDFKLGDVLEERGGPFESAPWVGLQFQMRYQQIDFGSGIEAKPKLMPTAFLGTVEVGTKTVATAVGSTGGGLREQVVAAIRPHKASGNFKAAQTAAFGIPGVADDEELVQALLDESGLYAEV